MNNLKTESALDKYGLKTRKIILKYYLAIGRDAFSFVVDVYILCKIHIMRKK